MTTRITPGAGRRAATLGAMTAAAILLARGDASGAPPGFAGWVEVGGNGTAQLADAAAVLGTTLYLVGVGTGDHAHYVNRYDGRAWSGWSPVPGEPTTAADLAVSFYDRLYLFNVGAADHAARVDVFDGAAWSGWTKIPAASGSPQVQPVAAAVHEGRIHLFGLTVDAHPYRSVFDGSGWVGWTAVPGGPTGASTPVALSAADFGGRLYLFAKGLGDHQRLVNTEAGGVWSGWRGGLGGPPGALADATVAMGDRLYLFGIGDVDHRHSVDVFDGRAWSGWSALDGDETTAVPDAATVYQARLHLFSVATGGHHFDDVLTGTAPPPLTFDRVQQKGSHNSYESTGRRESLFDQLEYHHIRSLELDIHRFEAQTAAQIAAGVLTGGLADAPVPVAGTEFAVYHEPFDGHGPTCTTLSACLRQLRAFHEVNPRHEPVSVFVEYKDTDWGADHMPADLDRDLAMALDPPWTGAGASWIYRPADLLASCPAAAGQPPLTLQGAIKKCGWPTLDALRGKVLFVVMQTQDDTQCTVALPAKSCDALARTVFTYAASDAEAATRAAFIAPNELGLAKSQAIFANMNSHSQTDLDKSACAAFAPAGCAGLPPGSAGLAPAPGGLSPRRVLESAVVRQTADTLADIDTHRAAGIQILGSDHTNIDTDPTLDTRGPLGWPFVPRDAADHPEASYLPDDETVVRLVATSGDLEGTADSFAFAYTTVGGPTTTWSAAVSGAGDSGNEWAKGCLMARESLDPKSSYFAVCRPEGGSKSNLDDTHPARVQYRDAGHAGTGEPEFHLNPVRDAVFLALDAWKDATGRSCYRGRASNVGSTADRGGSAETSPTVCYAAPLTLQGLAVSSHGDARLKFLFGGLQRTDGSGPAQALPASALPRQVTVGAGATYVDLGDGSFAPGQPL